MILPRLLLDEDVQLVLVEGDLVGHGGQLELAQLLPQVGGQHHGAQLAVRQQDVALHQSEGEMRSCDPLSANHSSPGGPRPVPVPVLPCTQSKSMMKVLIPLQSATTTFSSEFARPQGLS